MARKEKKEKKQSVRDKQKAKKTVKSDSVKSKKSSKSVRSKNKSNKKKQNARENLKESRSTIKYTPGAFAWVHMWITYIASMLMKDQRRIPDNIGNKILITNNMYVTARYMSVIIQVVDLGDIAPITYVGELIKKLRERGNTAIVDFSFKNTKYEYKPDDSGLKSRISIWEKLVANPTVVGRRRSNAERCLYTVEQAASGKQLKQTRLYLTVRAKDVDTLDDAELIIDRFFGTYHGTYENHYARVKQDLQYTSILGDMNEDLRGTVALMTSNTVMSQMVANCGSYNDYTGYYIGQNIMNGSPYYIDFSTITVGRNMYIVAPTGVGKTVLAINIMQSAFEHNAAVCAMDIKGNEYKEFIHITGGYNVSLRPTSYEYINSFVMHPEDCTASEAEQYFTNRFNFSKEQIIILSGISDRQELLSLEALLDEFLTAYYVFYGVERRNRNSWYSTFEMNPFDVYDKLVEFLTPDKMKQYNMPKTVLTTLGMYMSRNGSKSYVFASEFDFTSILSAPTVSFDFGILSNMTSTDIDVDLFRLKLLYMSKLKADFTTVNFNHGLRTLSVLEESQIVNDDILHRYAQEWTLNRARKQDTLLLGNSVQALIDNPESKSIVENTTCLFVGSLSTSARNTLIREYSLDYLEEQLMLPGSKPLYKNSFVVVNMMQDKELYPIIKVMIEDPNKYNVIQPSKEDTQYKS